jgi:hypothetical protein
MCCFVQTNDPSLAGHPPNLATMSSPRSIEASWLRLERSDRVNCQWFGDQMKRNNARKPFWGDNV